MPTVTDSCVRDHRGTRGSKWGRHRSRERGGSAPGRFRAMPTHQRIRCTIFRLLLESGTRPTNGTRLPTGVAPFRSGKLRRSLRTSSNLGAPGIVGWLSKRTIACHGSVQPVVHKAAAGEPSASRHDEEPNDTPPGGSIVGGAGARATGRERTIRTIWFIFLQSRSMFFRSRATKTW